MKTIKQALEQIEHDKRQLLAQETLLKEKRRHQIGLLAEEYDLLSLSDLKLHEVFQKIATQQLT